MYSGKQQQNECDKVNKKFTVSEVKARFLLVPTGTQSLGKTRASSSIYSLYTSLATKEQYSKDFLIF